ncbi:MAG TPA: histidine kinase [Actinomycetes bacterium]|nr:histidine kinase [Actinomycetes bacterium]
MTRKELARDAGLALVVFALTLAILGTGGFGEPEPGLRDLDALGVILGGLSALPLAARRLAPLAAYALAGAGAVALLGFGYPLDLPLGPGVAVYQLGVAFGSDPRPSRRGTAILAVALFVPAVAVEEVASGHGLSPFPELASLAVMAVALWIAGDRTRLRRERIAELEERTQRSEREADRERRLAAAEERTRIARELHDSAGHAINVILVQAGAARLLHRGDPEGSRRAIATVEEVARSTIGEIDRLVRALREDDGAEPPPRVDPAALEQLVQRHRAGGLTITTDVAGAHRALPRSVAWAAYRILQEALTNAARHGRGSADVALWFGADALEITVTNPTGSNGSVPGGGHGIVGMRERATLLGGILEAAVDNGVFRLHARLPYTGTAS